MWLLLPSCTGSAYQSGLDRVSKDTSNTEELGVPRADRVQCFIARYMKDSRWILRRKTHHGSPKSLNRFIHPLSLCGLLGPMC